MADDDVTGAGGGYGRPPKASQFRKGQSGNPRGRPPKKRADKRRSRHGFSAKCGGLPANLRARACATRRSK